MVAREAATDPLRHGGNAVTAGRKGDENRTPGLASRTPPGSRLVRHRGSRSRRGGVVVDDGVDEGVADSASANPGGRRTCLRPRGASLPSGSDDPTGPGSRADPSVVLRGDGIGFEAVGALWTIGSRSSNATTDRSRRRTFECGPGRGALGLEPVLRPGPPTRRLMLLLDTEAISAIAQGPAARRERVRALVAEMRRRELPIATVAAVLAEVLRGHPRDAGVFAGLAANG